MFTTGFRGDSAPVAVFAGDEEDAIELRLIDDIQTVRHREESHAACGVAAGVRIVQAVSGLPILVKSARPILKRNFVQRQVRWKSRTVASEDVPLHDIPKALLAGCGIQVDTARRAFGMSC